MAAMTLNAREKDGAKPVSITVNFPATVAEALKLYGEEVVYSLFKGQAVVRMQAAMRNLIADKKTPQQMVEHFKTWKPQSRKEGKSLKDKAAEILAKMSPEERAELLKAARPSK